jgi:peptidoglycan-N-acetylglucosamine deacetylase
MKRSIARILGGALVLLCFAVAPALATEATNTTDATGTTAVSVPSTESTITTETPVSTDPTVTLPPTTEPTPTIPAVVPDKPSAAPIPGFPRWVFLRKARAMYIAGVAAHQKVIVYTIDDVKDANAYAVVAGLKKAGITQAMLFVNVSETSTETARMIVANGYTLGSHGMYHVRPRYLTPQQSRDQIPLAAQTLYQMTGIWPMWYRAPFQDYSSYGAVAANGQLVAGQSLNTRDYDGISPNAIVANVVRGYRRGGIIMAHARSNEIAAMPRIKRELSKRGYRFVTLDNALRHYGNPVTSVKKLHR